MQKKFIIISILISLGSAVRSQTIEYKYYSFTGNETTKNKSFTYDEIITDSSHILVNKYNTTPNRLMESIEYRSLNPIVENGEYKSFHENGTISECGSYVNGVISGEWKSYFDNGKLQRSGFYQNGIITGIWKEYYDNGTLSDSLDYDLVSKIKFENYDTVYNYRDSMVKSPNYNFFKLCQKVHYPESAKNKKIQGKVVIEFIINKEGEIPNIEVLKSIEKNIDIEAKSLIANIKKLEPGKINGKPVNVKFAIPINFVMN
jgi:TonB family protein